MPTIRIDDEVYSWLESLARPFKDNPNSVLRRVAGIDGDLTTDDATMIEGNLDQSRAAPTYVIGANVRDRPMNAKRLVKEWGLQVSHALYHKGGTFYENLKRFPGALCDPHGCIVFRTEEEYRDSPYLEIGRKLNVRGGISNVPGYRRYCDSECSCRSRKRA